MKKRVKNCRLKYSIHITKAQYKTSGTMKTHHNYVSFRFFDYIIWFTTLLKLLASSFEKKKKLTSLSREADTFRRSSMLIETPANHFKISSDQNIHGPSQI